jgi:two-component system LytT family response regulator
MIRTIIIDDEENIRLRLKDMIIENFPQISIIGEADGVKSGVKLIEESRPELVLLDIRMEDGNAFDLLERVKLVFFKVIFITAYEEYALQAIKFSALDYLLKPVSVEDLRIAFELAENQILAELKLQLSVLQTNLHSTKNKTIALRTSEKIYLIDVNNIIRCKADRSYTYFFVTEQKKYIVSQPMKEFEEILKEYGFLRIHKSHLINMAFVDSFDKAHGGSIILKDNTEIPVSRRKKNELLELFSKL